MERLNKVSSLWLGIIWGGGATKWGNPIGVPRQSRAFLHFLPEPFFRLAAIFPFPFSLLDGLEPPKYVAYSSNKGTD